MNISEILQALYLAAEEKKQRKLVHKQADAYEDYLLNQQDFPNEALDLIIKILSDEKLFRLDGIDIFVLKIYTDMSRLSDNQKKRLLNSICENYEYYSNLDFCWQIGDLVARSYDQSTALQVFKRLFDSASDQGKEGIVLGLDILAKQSKRDPKLMNEVQNILGNPAG